MKILLFSQFYKPETMAASFRASENVKRWSQNHEVTVFTGYPNYPYDKIYDGYDVKLLSQELDGNVRILRSKVVVKPKTSIKNRIQNAFGLLFFGLINVLFQGKKIGKKQDVVLGTSGVVFMAFLGWLFAFLHRIPFVFEIRDITYRQLVATGKSETSASVRLMRSLELFLCKRAKRVVVVTNGFKEVLINDGILGDKIAVITNGVDVQDDTGEEEKSGVLTLSYFGTLGISQNICDTFIYAQEIRKICDETRYLIIGEGAQRSQIEEEIASGKYPFIDLLHGMRPEELEEHYRKTQLSVVTLKNSEDFKYTLPSKVFQAMGRGIAVLFIGPKGEAAELIQNFNCGIALTGLLDENIQTLRAFFAQENWRECLTEMGRNGRNAVMKHYSRTVLAEEYLSLLSDVCTKVDADKQLV